MLGNTMKTTAATTATIWNLCLSGLLILKTGLVSETEL